MQGIETTMRAASARHADMNERTLSLRRQGYRDSTFAVATALLAALTAAGPGGPGGLVLIGCAAALWLALRGRLLVQHSDPLTDVQRRELEKLRARSPAVKRALELLRSAGAEPVRLDLLKCRQLARLEARTGSI